MTPPVVSVSLQVFNVLVDTLKIEKHALFPERQSAQRVMWKVW
jgi:hypothetical protein